jgi:hypothetical protein
MKKLILASALTLLASGAFASDKFLGDTSEYYGNVQLDHAAGTRTDKLGYYHDHGDDVIKNHTPHGHSMPVESASQTSRGGDYAGSHDHGDDVVRNYTPHPHMSR